MQQSLTILLVLFQLLCLSVQAQQQNILLLDNPSFEGVAQPEYAPPGWFDCGFEEEYVNMMYAGYSDFAGVQQKAAMGSTYIGLVVRDNNTWEGVGQSLFRPLQVGNCYEFHLRLSKSTTFYSRDRAGERQAYHAPAKVKIWGGSTTCERSELLAETTAIQHNDWQNYTFVLNPQSGSVTHIRIESYHLEDSLLAYNGHVLIDHASFLVEVDCSEKAAIQRQEKSFLPPNWYLMAMSPSERLKLAKQEWKTKLVSSTYSEQSDPYKHKVKIRLQVDDQVDEAIRKFTAAIQVPADLAKDGFVITLVSTSLKEKKYTYRILQDALAEIGVPWEQYRIYSEIERKKEYREKSGKHHNLRFRWSRKYTLERIILALEEKIAAEDADPKADTFTIDLKAKKADKKVLQKRIKKAMKVMDILPSQYKVKFRK
ncbi:MAG: hypothetical protein AAGI49_14370 [Bacteroidota bacterium]